jgi:hypothetical protein
MSEVEEASYGSELLEDCQWYMPRFGFTCEAKDIGLDSYVMCLERDSSRCPFSVTYARSYYCKCSLRINKVKKARH